MFQCAILSTLSVLLLLTGCKLVVIVPSGGEVSSSSGDYHCTESTKCSFDVADLDFLEVFVPHAAPGYRFAGWRSAKRTLCGGQENSCEIASAGLASHPALLQLLESDEEFYLEPIFEQVHDGDIKDLPASVCFNERLIEPGARSATSYRHVDREGNETFSSVDRKVVGESKFNGERVMETESETTTLEAGQEILSRSREFLMASPKDQRVRVLGGEEEIFADGVPSSLTEVTILPHLLTRFDLEPGDFYTRRYEISSQRTVNGQLRKRTEEHKRTVYYLGVVSVSVPLGQYDVCQFEIVEIVRKSGFESLESRTEWIGVGNGLKVKVSDGILRIELASGSINGTSI